MPTIAPDRSSGVTTTTVNRVSEMTVVSRIRQGYTTPLGIGSGGHPIVDLTAPPVRYVDNLRAALQLVAMQTKGGSWIVLDDIATIHYARWVILPDSQTVLFTANFDGSFEQYIHDFVTVANSGRPTPDNSLGIKWMDLLWGNCEDWPGTDDFPKFLAWIRMQMIETTLFYPTISDVTVRDIAWLRKFRKLFATFDEAALTVDRKRWPSDLLRAYDEFKQGINRIDVTDV